LAAVWQGSSSYSLASCSLGRQAATAALLGAASAGSSSCSLARSSLGWQQQLQPCQEQPRLAAVATCSSSFNVNLNDNLVGVDGATTSNQFATTSSGNANKNQMECRALSQRITPKNFMNTVLKDLPKSHKAAIRKIGFGGFLDLDLDAHKSVFCSKLVSSFDCDRVSLVLERNQEIEITPVDIHLVYGLPMGGEIIKEQQQEEDEEWVDFIRQWRSYFGLSCGSPSNSVIINRIEELKKQPVCDEFIWHFVVSVVNCCMRSTANLSLNYRFLYSCMDTKKIECLDWYEYVYRSLKSSVSEWKGGSAFFTGPLPFLMICYFDRLQRSKISNPWKFPLLSVWKKDLIKERMKLEMKRGFGKGHVLDIMEVDRYDNNVSQVVGDPEFGGSDVSGSNEMLEFLQKFGTLAKKLAENLSEMHAMLDKANEIFAKEEASDMNTFIQNIWNKYSMRRKEKQKDSPSILSQDKHLFDEPAFIKELDDVMKRSWEKFKGKKKTPLEMTPLSFDLKGNVGKREKRCPENLPNCIRSPFMVQYDNIFKKVDGHKKRMAEYAFANGLPK
uniref:Uncharacterized protein n=1 Tax=Chenopodium quinoa TaxID=63459 RepID=A0A803MBJ7_CHEQI